MGSALLKVNVREDKVETAWAAVRRPSLGSVQPYLLQRSKRVWEGLELLIAHCICGTTHCYWCSKHHLPRRTKLAPTSLGI